MIKLLEYKIESITLYPTGCIIKTNIDINIKSNHLFLISIAGILNQIILMLFFDGYIFNMINNSLLLFNLLPIYPLDGYKIYLSILERFMKYRVVIKISYLLSMIFIFILFINNKNIYVFVLLYILNINYIRMYKYYFNKFILERYLYKYHYKEMVSINCINDLYKNKYNYINCIGEEEYLNVLYK